MLSRVVRSCLKILKKYSIPDRVESLFFTYFLKGTHRVPVYKLVLFVKSCQLKFIGPVVQIMIHYLSMDWLLFLAFVFLLFSARAEAISQYMEVGRAKPISAPQALSHTKAGIYPASSQLGIIAPLTNSPL